MPLAPVSTGWILSRRRGTHDFGCTFHPRERLTIDEVEERGDGRPSNENVGARGVDPMGIDWNREMELEMGVNRTSKPWVARRPALR
jgi:hypothetical protein